MNYLKNIFFFICLLFSCSLYAQYDESQIENVYLSECINATPGEFVAMGNSTLNYFQREFFKQNIDFKVGDWELNKSLYNKPQDAYYNTNPDPYTFDNISKVYLVPYQKPLIVYLRLNEIIIPPKPDSRFYVVRATTIYNKYPPVFNTTLKGCKIDENTQKYNLYNDQLIKEFYSISPDINPYIFEIYRKRTDTNPIPVSEWDNFILNKGETPKLYVKVTNKDSSNPCFLYYEITLAALDYSVTMDKTEYEFCGTPFTIDGPKDPTLTNFEWYHNGILKSSAKTVNIDDYGSWIVYFDNNLGCRTSVTVNIIKEKVWDRIQKVTATVNDITIHPFPNANIVGYSIDGINFQSSNVFRNQTDWEFTYYYKTKLGCIYGPFPLDTSTNFNFFSPNNDGINDKWDLRGKEKYPDAEIEIYDRFGKELVKGKLMKVLPWNGKVNNLELPSGSYWYVIKYDEKTIKSGYVILKDK